MKKALSLIFAFVMCTMLYGCMPSEDLPKNTETEPTTAQTEPHYHKYGQWTVTEKATCSKEGKQTRSCECGETDTLILEKKRHNYVESGRIEPTSSTPVDIQIVYSCTACDASYAEKMEITGTKGLICEFVYSEEYGVYCQIVDVDIGEFLLAKGSSDTFKIPAAICGYPVKVIADGAMNFSVGLKSIVIPDGVVYIGEDAFRTQFKVESITIPASVTYIGKNAIADCGVLKEIVFAGTLDEFYANVQMWNALNMPQIDPYQEVRFVCSDGIGYPFG